MSRYQSRSEVDFDARFDDRRSYGGRRHDDYREADISFRRGSGAPPTRERESVVIKERDEVDRRTPSFLRDDYGQTAAGPMVLRARDREDVTYASSRRRRSPSPERKKEREEIIIRDERSESRPRPPRARPREEEREREEIIIRRDERSTSIPPAPLRRPREESREREEIIIRRDERSESRPAAPRYRGREQSREREEIIIRRDERDEFAPPSRSRTAPIRDERDREEIIIRRDERDRYEDDVVSRRSYQPPPPPARTEVDRREIIIRREQSETDDRSHVPRRRYDDDFALSRPKSHERARGRSHSSASEEEIIFRREEREGRRGEESRQEIIIRKSSRSRSPSPATTVSSRPAPVQEPAPAPQPQVIYAPQIHQEVITHHRHIDHGYEVRQPLMREPVYSRPPSPPSPPPPPPPAPVRDESEERIEIRRTDTRNGRSEDQDIVISRRERSRSAGPPAPRYKQRDDFEIDYHRERDYEPAPSIGNRFGARRDPRDRLWTEITKDLVVKEAIKEMGYEFEETEENYYIFKYMEYADVARLVGLSEDIKRDRHKRINEIRWENEFAPRPAIAPASPRAPLAIEGPRERPDSRGWHRDDERFVEREVVYRGGRPPPPVGWRR